MYYYYYINYSTFSVSQIDRLRKLFLAPNKKLKKVIATLYQFIAVYMSQL